MVEYMHKHIKHLLVFYETAVFYDVIWVKGEDFQTNI